MICRYEFSLRAACPVDDLGDVYAATVEATGPIPVETILAEAAKYAGRKLFQEDIAAELCRALGAKVTLVGWHSGVKTTAVAE